MQEAAVISARFPAVSPLSFLALRRADRLIMVAAHNHLSELEEQAEQRRQQQQGQGGG